MKKSLILSLLILTTLITFSSAELTCPYGKVNDTYPGDCGLYTDTNKDNICDYSQEIQKTAQQAIQKTTKEYYMWQITLILTSLYLISLYLVKKQKISVIKNRKIWNMTLLISFIVTAISSIFLLVKINYGYAIFNINWAWWHIIFGYIMVLISIFHTLWHIPYFKSYFLK